MVREIFFLKTFIVHLAILRRLLKQHYVHFVILSLLDFTCTHVVAWQLVLTTGLLCRRLSRRRYNLRKNETGNDYRGIIILFRKLFVNCFEIRLKGHWEMVVCKINLHTFVFATFFYVTIFHLLVNTIL